MLHQPVASQVYLLQLTPARPMTFTLLLIKGSATVTVYRGHRRTLLPEIISLFVMCVGIIWNNSFVGGRCYVGVCWRLTAGGWKSVSGTVEGPQRSAGSQAASAHHQEMSEKGFDSVSVSATASACVLMTTWWWMPNDVTQRRMQMDWFNSSNCHWCQHMVSWLLTSSVGDDDILAVLSPRVLSLVCLVHEF